MILFRKVSFWLSVLGIAALTFYGANVQMALDAPAPPPPVTPPVKPYPQGGIAASGLIESCQENTNVGVPVNGLVSKLLVHVWDQIEAGQPLLLLDDRDLRAQLVTEQANIKVAEATVARLQDQLGRLKAVGDVRAISSDELKTKESDITVALAQVEAARAAVQQTQLLIDRLTVRAPISGTILQVNTRVGEYISVGSKPPVVMGSIADVQVRADVDEQVAPRVKAGKGAIGYLKGDTTHPIEMKFVHIEPFVVPKIALTGASNERVDTRVLQVIFAFKNGTDRPVYVGQQMDLYIAE